jgi:hypothetical protein
VSLQLEQKGDNNPDIDIKLNDLYSYYKNLIQNTKIVDKKKAIISLEKDAFSLIQPKSDLLVNETVFLESSLKLKTSDNFDSKAGSLFSYQPFVWTDFNTKSQGPSERRGHTSIQADTFLIIFGGCYMDIKCFNDLYFLDLKSHKWVKITATGKIPTPRQGHTAVMYGSTMWIYGGTGTEGFLSDLYSFNLETVK